MSINMEEGLRMFPPDNHTKNKKEDIQGIVLHKKKVIANERVVDLHGMTVEQSLSKLEQELISARSKGFVQLKVIYGKGYHSPNNQSVLRQPVQKYLDQSLFVSSLKSVEGNWGAIVAVINKN